MRDGQEYNSKSQVPDYYWAQRAKQGKWVAYNPATSAPDNFAVYDSLWRRPQDAELTGRGQVVGIIDQPLWRGHAGYRDRILDYQVVEGIDPGHDLDFANTSYHGAAVVSIAADKHIGIAPDAKIVYRAYASWVPGKTLHNHYAALKSMLDYVEDGNRLDVISTSFGWNEASPWGRKSTAIVHKFEEEYKIPVFSSITMSSMAMPCGPYGAVRFTEDDHHQLIEKDLTLAQTNGRVAIPVDFRPLACWHPGQRNYLNAFYYREAEGGISWAVPFVAGLFADARERRNGVDKDYPKITKNEFIDLLRQTAQTVTLGKYSFPAVDIKAFMEAVQRPGPIAPFDWRQSHSRLKRCL